MNIKVIYGTEEATIVLPKGSTVNDAIKNNNVKEDLQYGESIRVLLDGAEVDGCTPLRNGDELVVETKANQKA